MLEIIIIWSACSKLGEQAKARGFSGVPYGIIFVIAYIAALGLGAIIGGGVLGLNPVLGAYLAAIPTAFIAYYSLRAVICGSPMLPHAPGAPYVPKLPDGVPITFQCEKCGATSPAMSSQAGRVIQCPACKKGTHVKALPVTPPPLPAMNVPPPPTSPQ